MRPRPIVTLIAVLCALCALSWAAPPPHKSAPRPASQPPPLPILVAAMVHIDPFRATDSTMAISNYNEHRDGFLWYLGVADSLGVKVSSQAVGVYAEACIRQGHWSDFATSMPGGPHHFGTHVHPKLKTGPPYVWRDPDMPYWDDPDTVRAVMADNFPWINEIFTRNGYPIAANDFFHGSSAHYDGMDSVLWCPPTSVPLPYPNCFKMGDGLRGGLWVYRGPFGMEPHERADTSYLKIPEVGGIIGFNEVHGPEGFVQGELPFQKRDFVRAYMEWREMVRRGERSAVRHFTWMIHPYQLGAGHLGTDGVPVRDAITGLIDWLNANWIGQTDESGHVMAGYANAEEIRDHYDTWRAAHPVEEDSLEAKLTDNRRPLYLPGIYDRLITCYYVDEVAYPDTNVTVHEFADTSGHDPVFAVWTHADSSGLGPPLLRPVRNYVRRRRHRGQTCCEYRGPHRAHPDRARGPYRHTPSRRTTRAAGFTRLPEPLQPAGAPERHPGLARARRGTRVQRTRPVRGDTPQPPPDGRHPPRDLERNRHVGTALGVRRLFRAGDHVRGIGHQEDRPPEVAAAIGTHPLARFYR